MKCCSCSIDIPSQWKKCFEDNICPNCGGPILNDAVNSLINELAEALELMPNDPKGLAGWLVSNYEMRKIGSEEPVTKFYDGKKEDNVDTSKLKINKNNPLLKFYKNANLKSPEEYKKIKAQLDNLIDIDQEEEQLDIEDEDDLDTSDPDVQEVLAVVNKKSNKKSNKAKAIPLEDDGSDLHPALQQDRLERLRKQADIQSGEITKKGSFTRSY